VSRFAAARQRPLRGGEEFGHAIGGCCPNSAADSSQLHRNGPHRAAGPLGRVRLFGVGLSLGARPAGVADRHNGSVVGRQPWRARKTHENAVRKLLARVIPTSGKGKVEHLNIRKPRSTAEVR